MELKSSGDINKEIPTIPKKNRLRFSYIIGLKSNVTAKTVPICLFHQLQNSDTILIGNRIAKHYPLFDKIVGNVLYLTLWEVLATHDYVINKLVPLSEKQGAHTNNNLLVAGQINFQINFQSK